jgi:hypothetical protein
MSEFTSSEVLHDEQSHYEISLTAGQAFVAFVLLLLSLAASFAFGLMIGRGQADERLVVRKDPAVINESNAIAKKDAGRIVDLGSGADDFKSPMTDTAPAPTTLTEEAAPATTAPVTAPVVTNTIVTATPAHAAAIPVFAQLLSTSDQKTADALAAKLIDNGFMGAYVERKDKVFRVRVRFPSETEARAAETKLHEFSKEVWITK